MPLPAEIATRLETWDATAIWYTAGGIGLIAVGVLASAAVVAFTDQLGNKYIKFLGFVAAACTTLIAALNPLSIGLAFRDAWRVLDSAVLYYKSDPIKYPTETVIRAVAEGENILSLATKGLARSPEVSASGVKK